MCIWPIHSHFLMNGNSCIYHGLNTYDTAKELLQSIAKIHTFRIIFITKTKINIWYVDLYVNKVKCKIANKKNKLEEGNFHC